MAAVIDEFQPGWQGWGLRADAQRCPDATMALLQPNDAQARPVQGQGGRQAAWFVSGVFGQAVLRHYRRGGLMARLNRDLYGWTGSAARTRSWAEFELLGALHARGLPVPRPLAAGYWRAGPVAYRAAILVERIPGARPLSQVFDEVPPGEVAAVLARFHAAGVWHADLNATNVLLDEAGAVWLIDFDKGRLCRMDEARRTASLERLRRSLAKLAGPPGEAWWEQMRAQYDHESKRSPHPSGRA